MKAANTGGRQASLKVIAAQVGVSMMTVSRTLRGEPSVAEETAAKIRKVAEALKYRPNKLVEGLRTGRTCMAAAVMPASLGFYEDALRAIESSLDTKGYSLFLNLIAGDFGRDAMREEIRRLRRCIELRVDGIILRPVNDDANAMYFDEVVERGVPLVVIDRKLPDFTCDFVGTDDVAGGEAAAQKLILKGCRNILVVHAGVKVSTSRERRDGFLASARTAGLKVAELDCGNFKPSPEFLKLYFRQSEAKKIDGIFAVNDNIARSVIRALRIAGRSCPDQVKVIGFGHLPQSDPDALRLATFDQHVGSIGSEAVKLLMERLENPGKPYKSVYLPIEFIEGETF